MRNRSCFSEFRRQDEHPSYTSSPLAWPLPRSLQTVPWSPGVGGTYDGVKLCSSFINNMRSSSFVVSYSWHSCSLCLSQSSAAIAVARAPGVYFHCKGVTDMGGRECHRPQGRFNHAINRQKVLSDTSVTFDLRMPFLLGTGK